VLLAFAVAFTWLAFSLGGALMNPALGTSVGSRFAEWARGHGASGIVNWAENEWYKHHAPPVGGTLPAGAIHNPTGNTRTISTSVHYLPTPKSIVPFAHPAIAGEGDWRPVGRRVDGIPAIYETTLRPDSVHTSYVAGVAWIDTKLLRATLYSGGMIPGGGPYPFSAPVQTSEARTLVAAFNSGFLMSNANGGYYTAGRMELPLRKGAASFVVYRNGTSDVVSWGNGVTMNSSIVSVRQNLDLLVSNGQPAAGLSATDTTKWGYTLGNAVYVWRSGLGITANGALVYVGGPGLNITDLANLLVRAGAVRGMELDINTDWVNFTSYKPSTPNGIASGANGAELLPSMTGTPARYFESWWARDFITMNAIAPKSGNG
jgi:Phosphodiester glycosidase